MLIKALWLESLSVFLPLQAKFWLAALKTIKDFYTNFYGIYSIGLIISFYVIVFSVFAIVRAPALILIVLFLLQYYQILICNAVRSTVGLKQISSTYIKEILIKSFSFAWALSLLLILLFWISNYWLINILTLPPVYLFFFLDSKLFFKFNEMSLMEVVKSVINIFYNSFVMLFYNFPFFLIIYGIFLLINLKLIMLIPFFLPAYYSIVSNFYIKNKYEHFNLYKEA